MYIYIYTYKRTYIYKNELTHTLTHTCIYIYMYVCACVCVCVCEGVCKFVYIYERENLINICYLETHTYKFVHTERLIQAHRHIYNSNILTNRFYLAFYLAK